MYDRNFEMFLAGLITEGEWVTYCTKLLEEIMTENKDVFIRLKDR